MRTWPALVLDFPASATDPQPGAALQDLVSATLDGLDVSAVEELPDGQWRVYFKDDDHRAAATSALRESHGSQGLAVRTLDVPDEDWARRSQAALRAVRVGNIVVAPPWDMPAEEAGERAVTIVIEPAMGFGSGHHATTRLCLAALQRLDIQGRRVLDIGTGSGVLALAAARLGAQSAAGVDVDADALDNARGNAALNGNPPTVKFREADFRQAPLQPADIVLANLTGGMLAANFAAVVRLVAPAGSLVLSGITSEERDQVLAAYAQWGRVDWTAEEDGWCAALLSPLTRG
jgi:ribosomal protein L11 methyltransferase